MELNRPEWTNFFLGLARAVSKRSPDCQTQHGTIIVDSDHRIVSLGYNGFPRGMDDETLPNTRPDKYDWMDHSEENALDNARTIPYGCTAYITGPPCFPCLKKLWRKGIKKIVHIDGYSWQGTDLEKQVQLKQRLIKDTGLIIFGVRPDLSWLVDMVLDDKELRELVVKRLKQESSAEDKYNPKIGWEK